MCFRTEDRAGWMSSKPPKNHSEDRRSFADVILIPNHPGYRTIMCLGSNRLAIEELSKVFSQFAQNEKKCMKKNLRLEINNFPPAWFTGASPNNIGFYSEWDTDYKNVIRVEYL